MCDKKPSIKNNVWFSDVSYIQQLIVTPLASRVYQITSAQFWACRGYGIKADKLYPSPDNNSLCNVHTFYYRVQYSI
jgi:hypothetical protein